MIGETIYKAIYIRLCLRAKYSSGIYLICLCIAQTLRVCVHRLAAPTPTPICIAYPHHRRLPYYYYLLYRRSKVASSLAQQLHLLSVDVSNRMALNSRVNRAEILHLNIVSWYLHLKTWLLILPPCYTFVMVILLCPAHCGKCFYNILTSHMRLVSSFFSSFAKTLSTGEIFKLWGRKILFWLTLK